MASIVDSSWTTQATEVVSQACEYYGGLDRWRALALIRLFPKRLSGLVPWLKGAGVSFPLPSTFEVIPRRRCTRFVDFPAPGQVGIFENGDVRIERVADGALLASSDAHRQTFRGLSGLRRWAPLDGLYFFGYALSHYHSLPFTLLDGRLLGVRTAFVAGQRVTVLSVELPADLDTHCRRQSFYFDAQGKLLRHDYHAEIVGILARGAHYWNCQTRCNGLPVALDRHVVLRLGSLTFPLTALHATFTRAEVEFD